MADGKPFDWGAKAESLEAKFKLMCRLPYDPRVRRRHILVYGFILDWYHSKYGDALASVRHVHGMVQDRDPAGKGLYIGEIHGALADLVAWGYLTQEKGKGRRASRYVPAWTVLERSVQETPNANDNDRSVLKSPNTSVQETPNATARSVLKSLNEDPSTLTRVIDPGTGMDEIDCGAATPPPVDALSGTTAGTPQEERYAVPADRTKWFDYLYAIYGVRKGKAAARRAFEKIDPDLPAFTAMVEAAREWRQAAGGIDRKWLSTWLNEECFDEEPNGPRVERPTKAKAGKPPKPASRTDSKFHPMRFTKADEHGDSFGGDLFVDLEFENDEMHIIRQLHILAAGGDGPDIDVWRSLLDAAGGKSIGTHVGVKRTGEKLEFEAVEQPVGATTAGSDWPDWPDAEEDAA